MEIHLLIPVGIFWFVISFFSVLSYVVNDKYFDTMITPYGVIVMLPTLLIILPFWLVFLIGKAIFTTKYAQIAHKFMSTPINELITIRIRVERK